MQTEQLYDPRDRQRGYSQLIEESSELSAAVRDKHKWLFVTENLTGITFMLHEYERRLWKGLEDKLVDRGFKDNDIKVSLRDIDSAFGHIRDQMKLAKVRRGRLQLRP